MIVRHQIAAAVFLVLSACGSQSDTNCHDTCEWVVFGDLKLNSQPVATLRATLRVGETIDVTPVFVGGGCTTAVGPDFACEPTSATWTSSDPAVATVTPRAGSVRAVVLARGVGVTVIFANVAGRPATGAGAQPAGQTKENLTITVTP